jgi:signal transduction histidine kinase
MSTIHQQLTRKLLLGFALLLGCGGLAVYFSVRAALLKQFDATLRAKAMAITTVTQQRGNRIEVGFTDQFMREFDERVATDFFQMRRADGTTIKRSESLNILDLPSRLGTLEHPKFWNLRLPSGAGGRAIGFRFTPRMEKDEKKDEEKNERRRPVAIEVSLVVASERGTLDATLATLGLVLAGCGAFLLAATLLIVPRVLRRELTPLDRLADQASRINADSLASRFPIDSLPGELAPISSRLNDLLARLEQSFERERRFSADLAHELRTPIAELRSLAELALKWPETRDPETDADVLAAAIQMEGITVRLLELLRSERGQLISTREAVLLAPLAESLCQPFSGKVAEKQLKLIRNLPDDAEIESDPVLLRSILTNLVDNAVEYTPPGGKICIDAGIGSGYFTVRVVNTTQQIDRSDLTRFFDRFWRKDANRSGNQHSGLGLSLALAFAQALDYELTAALDGQSRLVMTLSGPAVSASTETPLTVV